MQTHTTNDQSQTITQLNSFLRGELSAVESYRLALEHLEQSEFRATLVQCSRSHEERARLLTEAILGRGGEPSPSSGAWGSLVRMIERSAIRARRGGCDRGPRRRRGSWPGRLPT